MMAKTVTRKSEAKRGTLIVLAIFVLIAVIGGTYAKYTSGATGSGAVNIAQWQVKVNDQPISNTASGTFDLAFTANNANTAANRVAPGGTATAYVDIDLTGTEVSVDFTCALATTAATNLTSVFGEGYNNKVTVNVGTPTLLDGATSMTTNGTTVTVGTTAMNGTVRVPITLTWTDAAANNTNDTNTGATKTDVTIPVTLTVAQHTN